MNEYMISAKAAIVAFLGALSAYMGWRTVMVLAWLVLMAMDYISGTLAARKVGTWKSSTAREGLWHKGGMILVVLASLIADAVMLLALPQIPILNIAWPKVLFPMVLAWYIITEMGSILENAIRIGAKVPLWLVKILDASLKTVNTAGDLSSKIAVPPEEASQEDTKT